MGAMASVSALRRAALPLAAVAVLAFVAGCGGGVDIEGADSTNARFASIPQHGITLGADDATLTMTEFADLQCPFCRRFDVNAMPTIVERYVRPGKLRIVFRSLAFLGDDSVRGARMAGAVGLQNHLFEFADLFFENQGEENSGYADDDFLRALAEAIPGVDADRAFSDRDRSEIDAQLAEADSEADKWQVPGTPTFLLGPTGQEPSVLHIQSLEADAFVGPIDAMLAK